MIWRCMAMKHKLSQEQFEELLRGTFRGRGVRFLPAGAVRFPAAVPGKPLLPRQKGRKRVSFFRYNV